MGHQGPSHDEHLKLTAAAVPGQPVPPRDQGREVVVYQVQVFPVRFAPARGRAYPEVLLDGKVFEGLAALENLDNSQAGYRLRRRILDRPANVFDGALGYFAVLRLQQSRNGLERRCLAGPIAPQERYYLSLLDHQGDPLEHLDHLAVYD